MNLGFIDIPGIPGMRMVIFSVILVLIMIFARQGLMGTREFNWNWLCRKLGIGGRS
jgi:branched-chain amino acid transport system permease protein